MGVLYVYVSPIICMPGTVLDKTAYFHAEVFTEHLLLAMHYVEC